MSLLLPISDYAFDNKWEKWFYISLGGLLASLFVPYPNFIQYGLLVSVYLLGLKIRTRSFNRSFLIMVCFFVWMVASLMWSENIKHGISVIGMRLPLLISPLVFGFVVLNRELKIRLLIWFSKVTTLAAILCILFAFREFKLSGDSAVLYNDSLSKFIGKQSIYAANLVNISIIIYLWLLIFNSERLGKISSVYLSLSILFLFQILLASRVALIILIIVVFFLFLFNLRKPLFFKRGLAFVGVILVIAVGVVYLFPKTLNRFIELKYSSYDFKMEGKESHYNMEVDDRQWNGANTRLALWKIGLEESKDNLVFGVGVGDKNDKLFNAYKNRGFSFALKTQKNLHNNYIDVLFSTGLIGLLLFIVGYGFFPIMSTISIKDEGSFYVLSFLIILSFLISFLTEVYFDRSFGSTLVSIFFPFLLSKSSKD